MLLVIDSVEDGDGEITVIDADLRVIRKPKDFSGSIKALRHAVMAVRHESKKSISDEPDTKTPRENPRLGERARISTSKKLWTRFVHFGYPPRERQNFLQPMEKQKKKSREPEFPAFLCLAKKKKISVVEMLMAFNLQQAQL